MKPNGRGYDQLADTRDKVSKYVISLCSRLHFINVSSN